VKYKVTHTTKYAYSEAVPVCHNLLHLAPRGLDYQNCEDFKLMIHPQPAELDHRTDSFGNPVSFFSIDQAHLRLTVTASSHVQVLPRPAVIAASTDPWEEVVHRLSQARTEETLEAYPFILDSPRVVPFERIAKFASESFPAKRPILECVIDLTRRIHEEFKYAPRKTTVDTSIEEVFEKRHGVCQDFAHFQIGCLRSIGLAARYASGYLRTEPPEGEPRLVGADASHAWISFYCGKSGWIDLDPTNNILVSTNHITLAWGRDYNDVCPVKGVIIGGGNHQMHVSVDVAPEKQSQSQMQSQT
jgi:transglutaminase-like putative cysteine protease